MTAVGGLTQHAGGCITLLCKGTHLQPISAWGCQTCRTLTSSNPAGTSKSSWPVIIAGAGPSGLTLALWLSRFGVRSLVLEKALETTKHPQAHYINNRSMEVLRPLWGLSQEIVAHSPPLSHWRMFRYGFSMTGETLGVVDHFKGQPTAYNSVVSPEPVTHLPQHQLVPMMLSRAAAPHSLVTLLWGHNVVDFAAQADKVVVMAEDAQHNRHTFHGSFLAAADGAHSTVRQQLGIHQAGQEGIQNLINVHFTSPSLGAYLLMGGARNNRPTGHSKAAMLYFVFNPEVVGVVVAHNLARGEFVMQLPYLPPLQSVTDFPEARCRQLIAAASGLAPSQLMDLAIHEVRPWRMNAVIADSFQYTPPQAAQGTTHSSNSRIPVPRVFLVGDAAHRFPPAGGLGMNTGIQDAHNLAWKLALVLKQAQPAAETAQEPSSPYPSSSYPSAASRTPAFDSMRTEGIKQDMVSRRQGQDANAKALVDAGHLLSTYEVERRPVVVANCALSMRNWAEAVGIPSALGLDPRAADALNSAVSSMPLVPAAAGKALLEAGLAVGRALTTTQWSPLRPIQLARIRAKFKSGITLRLQYPREDLGFRYAPSTAAKRTAVAASLDIQPPTNITGPAVKPQRALPSATAPAAHAAAAASAPAPAPAPAAAAAATPPTAADAAADSAARTTTGMLAGRSQHGSPTSKANKAMAGAAGLSASPASGPVDLARDEPYDPSTEPGCRLPHVWLRPLQYGSNGGAVAAAALQVTDAFTASADEWAGRRRPDTSSKTTTGLISTIDIAAGVAPSPPSDGPQTVSVVPPFLTLFVDGHGGPQNSWLTAWQALQQQWGGVHAPLPVSVVQVVPADVTQAPAPMDQGCLCTQYQDINAAWHNTMQLPYGSVLLVRPDGHVAWRHGPLATTSEHAQQGSTTRRHGGANATTSPASTAGSVASAASVGSVASAASVASVASGGRDVEKACGLLTAALRVVLQGHVY